MCGTEGCGSHRYWSTTAPTRVSLTRVCQGRHCAHTNECNRFIAWNG
jgi:hypothetical protein